MNRRYETSVLVSFLLFGMSAVILPAEGKADTSCDTVPSHRCTVSVNDSVTDHGDSQQEGSLAYVLSTMDPKRYMVVELPGNTTYPIKQNLILPPNITLKFHPGAVLAIDKKAVLTVNCTIQADAIPIFDGEGLVTGDKDRSAWKGALGSAITAVYPQWFGARGDGKTDDAKALQKAVDFACRAGILNVCLGNGQYRLTQTLNLTSLRTPGALCRDSLRIHGTTGFGGACLIGDTGDGHAVVEISGIQFGEFEKFSITSGKENPSTVGLFMGIPKELPQTQNNVLHISIVLPDDMKANDGLGTIGLWNFAAEENTFQCVYFVANRPVILTAFNDFPNPAGPLPLNYKHSFVEQLKVHSMGMTSFSGECYLQSTGGAPVFTTQCANTLKCENTYINGLGKTSSVFEVYGSLVNLDHTGVVEGRGTFLRNFGTIKNSEISVTYGGIHDSAAPLILMGDTGEIANSTIKFALEGEKERNLVSLALETAASENSPSRDDSLDTRIAEGTVNGIAPDAGLRSEKAGKSAWINTTVFTNLERKYLTLPESLRKGSRNSTVYGHDASIRIK